MLWPELQTKGMFIWDELARLGELAHQGKMFFIPRSNGVFFYLTSIKKFVMSQEKYFYNNQWLKAVRNKLRQKLGLFIQN